MGRGSGVDDGDFRWDGRGHRSGIVSVTVGVTRETTPPTLVGWGRVVSVTGVRVESNTPYDSVRLK